MSNLVGVSAPTAGITIDGLIKFLDASEAQIPKIKAVIDKLQLNPMWLPLAERIIPGISQFMPLLEQVGPILDFLLQVEEVAETIAKAIQAALPPS